MRLEDCQQSWKLIILRVGTHGWSIRYRKFDSLRTWRAHGTIAALRIPGALLGDVTQMLILWLTDSKAAISTVTVVTRLTATPCRYPNNDIDYVPAICELHKSLGGRRLKTKWIKGHQDDQQEYNELSCLRSQTQCWFWRLGVWPLLVRLWYQTNSRHSPFPRM